jgi:hypothetical protein
MTTLLWETGNLLDASRICKQLGHWRPPRE